jgi:hypothetical protein
MKKILIITLSAVVVLGLTVGGFLFYKTSTPEYALAKTIEDVKLYGMDGLKPHLTEDAIEKVEAVEEWVDKSGVSGMLAAVTQDSAVSFIKSKMAEVDWTVEDVLKGKIQTDVVIGFDYNNSIVGTIEITMIRDGREWKIDGLNVPSFDKFSLR